MTQNLVMSGQNVELERNPIYFPIEFDPFPDVLCDKKIECDQFISSNEVDIKLNESSSSEQYPGIYILNHS